MSENTSKQWSTEEIIKHSDNWSLAGDVALLNTIKSFANNLLSKADILNDNVNNLLHGLDEVSLKLDICQNEFQNLKNTQFIESRVYDDDEALDSKDVDDETSTKPEDNESDISLTDEIKLLDEYYETLEISGSDSEDELEKSFVLKEKDIYEDRQLPPLIGSDEWYKNWYIKDEDDDLDSNESSEIYSGSCSDEDLPKDLFNGSQTSSELEFSNKMNDNDLIANSTVKQESTISSEDSENANSSVPQAPVSNLTFAEQLAAKLDNVISRDENVNKKPIQKQMVDPFSAGLFADEPPPLNDSDEIISEEPIVKKQLFDDEDNNSLFWQESSKPNEGIKSESNLKVNRDMLKSSQVSKGLFDSDSSDDDLFNPKTKIPANKPTILLPNKPIVPLFDEEPPSLENSQKFVEQPKKKPVGAVSIFGEKDIGDIFSKPQLHDTNVNKPNTKKDSPKEEASFPKNESSTSLFDSNKNNVNKKISSLFDDNEDDEDDIFSNTKQTKNYSLFDDDDDNVEFDYNKKKIDKKAISLFDSEDESSNNNISANENKTKKNSLFDYDDEDNLMFSNTTEKSDSKLLGKSEETKNSEDSHSNNAQVAEKEFISDVINDNNIDVDTKGIFETVPSRKTDTYDISSKKISLFDDDEDEDDPLFSSITKKSDSNLPKPQEPQQPEDTITATNPPIIEKQFVPDKMDHSDDSLEEIFAKNSSDKRENTVTEESNSARPVIGLFASSPPPDDGDWDTKSDQFSDTDDFVAYRRDENVNKARLFDDDPPDDDDDSFDGIATQTDTRMDKDISDTYANDASSDIFSDKADKNDAESRSVDAMTTTPGGLSEGFHGKANSSESNKTETSPSNPQLDIKDKDVRKPNKIADITERLNKPKPAKPIPGLKTNSPGKLKQTLNINVNALLPGLSQPKIKHLTKTQAKDSDENQTPATPEIKIADADDGKSKIADPHDGKSKIADVDDGKSKIASKTEPQKLAGFDVPDHIEILPSITKERAKNPAKRRPSTRRARQQAIRKSLIENDDLDSPDELPSATTPEGKKSDLLEVTIPEVTIPEVTMPIIENVETETVETNTNTDISKKANKLFNSESESDTDDLFKVSKKSKPKSSIKKSDEVVKKSVSESNTRVSLFDDKSDDDLFEQLGNKEKKPMKSDKKKIATKKSLFDEGSSDEDDDDELFSSRSDKRSASISKPFEKTNKPIIKKLENVETKDDPLSNLLD
ncbi:unnamed protein product [Phyllotreta striolata]|uniref:FAM21/CAPZIP domain-containing protein n=1 Tax=Phyllotreta striolata TaxID=444603 RepID=A0A9N9THT8_PHYSR|nr:unnamed protein product [Phyllotreta striolata]